MPQLKNTKYRAEIDGLRAVAVVLVVLFHLGLGFSGGYVGVDVFFVISGYLITRIILEQQCNGTWSFYRFWYRRFMRLAPALAGMVLAVLVGGYFLLLPSDYKNVAEAAIAQFFMVANIYVWQTTGYFDGPSGVRPLLHGWSLAVEEQFYLVYPIFVVLLARIGHRILVGGMLLVAVMSLLMSEYGAQHHPVVTFLLLPTRAWELLLGGLLVKCPKPSDKLTRIFPVLGYGGIAAVILSGIFFSDETRFPGFSALVPCLGTAAIILSTSVKDSGVRRLLSWAPLVFIGQISYSMYLWHWPIIAFWSYHNLGVALSVWTAVQLLALTVCCGYLSWKYLEQPLRIKPANELSFRFFRLTKWSIGLVSSCIILAGAIIHFNGFDSRLSAEAQCVNTASIKKSFARNPNLAKCGDFPRVGSLGNNKESIDFIVWGDSHALQLVSLIDEMAQGSGKQGIIASMPGTVPALDVWRTWRKDYEREWNENVMQWIEKKDIKDVILVCFWSQRIGAMPEVNSRYLISGPNSDSKTPDQAAMALSEGLEKTIKRLAKAGRNVWVVGQMPFTSGDPKKEWLMNNYFGKAVAANETLGPYVTAKRKVDHLLDSIDAQFERLDPACQVFEGKSTMALEVNGTGLWFDKDHLSVDGAHLVLAELFQPLKNHLLVKTADSRSDVRVLQTIRK